MSSIREKCEQTLGGIDEDILEYIVSMIEDQLDDLSEISEGIAGFILSSDFVDTEEDAQALTSSILEAVQSDTPSSVPVSNEPQLLKTKLVMSKDAAESLPPPPKKDEVQASFGRAEITSKTRGSKKAGTTAIARVLNSSRQLEEELEAARVHAARARTKEGAFNGALGKHVAYGLYMHPMIYS